MNKAALSFLALAFTGPAVAETYHVDPSHTEIRVYYNHAGITEQSGEWTGVSGTIEFDPNDVTATMATITVDAASVSTGVTALDDDLKSKNFFEVSAFPKMNFVSTSAVQTGADSLRLTGDLTIRDVTAPIILDVRLTYMGTNPMGAFFDYYSGDWIGVHATSTLLRSDLGVGQYAPLISDEIRLEISAEMKAGGWN